MRRLDALVDGRTVSAVLHSAPQPDPAAPLVVALHGGTYTGEYFCIAGSPAGSFVEIANNQGFSVLRIDRPGYGGSDPLTDDENTFAQQAHVLDHAIAALLDHSSADCILLVGHSIGGMIAMEIAARQPQWPLIGLAVSGMGARIPAGGAAEQLGALPLSGIVDLPIEEREKLWYGPPSGVSEDAITAARSSFAPAPMIELKAAPQWAAHRLADVAAAIRVPVHHTLAEFDSLWDPSESARKTFVAKFDPTLAVHSEIMSGVGHCIDHHLDGAVMHNSQLAFGRQCARATATNPM